MLPLILNRLYNIKIVECIFKKKKKSDLIIYFYKPSKYHVLNLIEPSQKTISCHIDDYLYKENKIMCLLVKYIIFMSMQVFKNRYNLLRILKYMLHAHLKLGLRYLYLLRILIKVKIHTLNIGLV